MSELANEFSGASIISSSSYDPKNPPASVIDGEYNTFWMTTGVFPQEIVIQLGEPSLIKGVELMSTGIRKVELAKSEGPSNMWETIVETESTESDSEVQRMSLQAPPRVTAGCLRIRVCTCSCVFC
jgi:heat shock protein beta-11